MELCTMYWTFAALAVISLPGASSAAPLCAQMQYLTRRTSVGPRLSVAASHVLNCARPTSPSAISKAQRLLTQSDCMKRSSFTRSTLNRPLSPQASAQRSTRSWPAGAAAESKHACCRMDLRASCVHYLVPKDRHYGNYEPIMRHMLIVKSSWWDWIPG